MRPEVFSCPGRLSSGLTILAALTLMLFEAASQVPTPKASGGLPASVLDTTRKQIREYLGNTSVKGIPLLDPAIDWDQQSNWPDQFVFQGWLFKLDIRDLSNNGFKQLRRRAEIKPSMKVNFWYVHPQGRPAADPNAISPRGTWTPGKRVADKQMMWGGWEDVGESARNIFDYTFYPSGTLFRVHFQTRAKASSTYQVFDCEGKLVASAAGTNYFWKGRRTERWNFWNWSKELYDRDGVLSRVTGDAGAPGSGQRPGPGTNRPPSVGMPRPRLF